MFLCFMSPFIRICSKHSTGKDISSVNRMPQKASDDDPVLTELLLF